VTRLSITRLDDPDRDTCRSCPASREGCWARQQFARQHRCRRCTHPDPVLDTGTRTTVPGMRHLLTRCADPFFPLKGTD